MTYSAHSYAASLFQVLRSTPEEKRPALLESFVALLKKNNDWSKRHAIVEAFTRVVQLQTKQHTLTITTARTIDPSTLQPITDALTRSFGKMHTHIATDSRLIGGVVLLLDGQYRLDFSVQRIFTSLFNS